MAGVCLTPECITRRPRNWRGRKPSTSLAPRCEYESEYLPASSGEVTRVWALYINGIK